MLNTTNIIEIRLRAMEPEDIDLLYSIENLQHEWYNGATTMPYSRDVLRQYILSTTGDIFIDKQLRLIIETTDGAPVGLIDLTSFDPKNLHAEVGIAILPSHRHKGIASQALCQLEEYAGHTIHLHQLYAIVPDINNYSLQLFKKRGFKVVANLQDWLFDGKNYQNAQLLQKII